MICRKAAKHRSILRPSSPAGRPKERDSLFLFHGERARRSGAVLRDGRLLLQKGAELTPRAAVALGDREAVLRMHREGRLPNEIHIFRGGLLGIAVRMNRLDMVATLLDLGLDPNESDEREASSGMPLWFASMCGRHEIAELLLARGADVDAVVCACGDSMGRAEDEKMKALLPSMAPAHGRDFRDGDSRKPRKRFLTGP